jgi:minor extracellular protease Epr
MRVLIVFKEQSDPSVVTELGGTVLHGLNGLPTLLIAEIPDDMKLTLSDHPSIVSVEEDILRSREDIELHANYKTQQSGYAYHLNTMRAMDYWERGLTGKGIKVAVMDSGIGRHYALPNLKGGIDLGSIVQDYMRDDQIGGGNGHGTRCAGLIGGKPFPGSYGLLGGMAPNVELYSMKYFGDRPWWASKIAEVFSWCIDNNIDILSASLGTSGAPQIEGVIMQAAIDAGLLLVCSAGNTNAPMSTTSYPACLEDAVVVGGTDEFNKRYSYNYGPTLDFLAPCRQVESITYTAGGVISLATMAQSGTSFSAPLVAGVMALYKEAFPDMPNKELIQMVKRSATKIDGKTGWDQFYGWGIPAPSKEIMARPKVARRKGQRFYGNGDYIDCGNATSLNIKDKLTLTAKLNQSYRSTGHVFAKCNPGGSSMFYSMLLANDGMYAEYRQVNSQVNPRYAMSLNDNLDHTVTFVYDHPSIKMYVDGQLVQSTIAMVGTTMDLSAAADRLYMGSNTSSYTGSFSGVIYNAKIYNRALSDAEVLSDHEGVLVSNGLKLYYEFTGAETSQVLDLSGNGNNGTVYGAKPNVKVAAKKIATGGITVPVSDVTNLTATKTDHSITLSWTASTASAAKYDVYDLTKDHPLSANQNAVTYTINNLLANKTYSYKVVTTDSFGNVSPGVLIAVTTNVDVTVPNAVTGLTASFITSTTTSLTWTASSSTDVSTHEVWKGAVASVFANATLLDADVKTLGYHLTDLSPSTTYNIWIVSRDLDGNKSTPVLKTIVTTATTTILYKDSFSVADSTLGTTEVGAGTWSVVAPATFSKQDGYAFKGPLGDARHSAWLPVNTNNYAVEFTIPDFGNANPLVYFRIPAADFANSMYINRERFSTDTNAPGLWYIRKMVGGSQPAWSGAVPDGNTGVATKAGDKLRIETITDGTIVVIINGKFALSVKDTNHQTVPGKVGMAAQNSLMKFDNFKVETL